MTEFSVTADIGRINFMPATATEEVLQNVKTILTTRKGTVPFDRNFGLDWRFVDQPMAVAQAMLSGDVIQQIGKYEPRAFVIRVGFSSAANSADGQLKPVVVVGVNL